MIDDSHIVFNSVIHSKPCLRQIAYQLNPLGVLISQKG